MKHVDMYGHSGFLRNGTEAPLVLWDCTPRRCDDVDEMDYLRTNGGTTPYCNGYTWRTPPHEDGECERWAPPMLVFEPETSAS